MANKRGLLYNPPLIQNKRLKGRERMFLEGGGEGEGGWTFMRELVKDTKELKKCGLVANIR